eukprot:Lankesteria_metandrocarpae@DN1771_c0_g1_i1.p1
MAHDRTKLREPQSTAAALFIDRKVAADLLVVSTSDGTKHDAHIVAIASRVTDFKEVTEKYIKDPIDLALSSKKTLRVKASAGAIEVFLSWVYLGNLTGINESNGLEALRIAEMVDAVEFALEVHDWFAPILGDIDDTDIFRLLANCFVFVQHNLATMYITALLRRGADFEVGAFYSEDESDPIGTWGLKLIAAARKPKVTLVRGKKAVTVSAFDMSTFSDLTLISRDKTEYPTYKAFWAQCPQFRQQLSDAKTKTLVIDGSDKTVHFLSMLINGVKISSFGLDTFKKVYTLAIDYDLIKVQTSMEAIALEIFDIDTRLDIIKWSVYCPKSNLGPLLLLGTLNEMRYSDFAEATDYDTPINHAGAMAIKLSLATASLNVDQWHELDSRAMGQLSFLHTESYRLLKFA